MQALYEIEGGFIDLVEKLPAGMDSAPANSEVKELEASDYEEVKDRYIRPMRDDRLARCDWTQLPDVLANGRLTAQQVADWASYRQDLADLVNDLDLSELDSLSDIAWPSQP